MADSKTLTHTDVEGRAKMVNVGHKKPMLRTAIAEGFIRMKEETANLIKENEIKKGDVLAVSEIAGVQGAKMTSNIIPLCHPINITHIDVSASIEKAGVYVRCSVECIERTGIEMEALMGVNAALLTVYDMCKGVDKTMIIENIMLIEKKKKELSHE